jgi:nucleoside-diphosphate-sugar epimerase
VSEVRSVARRPVSLPERPQHPDGTPPARLTHVLADLCDPGARRALEGADILYHLAAQVWQARRAGGREAMYAANVGGTLNVLRARPGAVVLASSAAVYGAWPDNPLPLEESHPASPNHECPYAQQKLLSEAVCAQEAGCWCVVRLAAVLGPHADARVARAVRGYRVAVPAARGVTQAVQWLDEADAVEGLLAAGRDLLERRQTAGQVLNVAPADWLGAREAAVLAGSRVLEVPRRLLVAGADLGRGLGLTPFGADRAALILGPLALSVAKAGSLLGWQPSRTSAEVFADALARDWRRAPRNRVA